MRQIFFRLAYQSSFQQTRLRTHSKCTVDRRPCVTNAVQPAHTLLHAPQALAGYIIWICYAGIIPIGPTTQIPSDKELVANPNRPAGINVTMWLEFQIALLLELVKGYEMAKAVDRTGSRLF